MMRTTLAAACLVLAVGFAPAQTVTLRLQLPEGTTYHQRTTQQQTIKQNVMGMQQEIESSFQQTSRSEVTEVRPDGAMVIEITTTRVRNRSSVGGMVMEYDSENPPANPDVMASMLEGMVGSTMTVVCSPSGQILEMSGFDAMMDDMFRGAGGEMPPALREQMNSQFGEEAMRESMALLTDIYPERPISIGDSFTSTASLPSMMNMRVSTSYTLRAVENGLAILDVSGSMDTMQGSSMDMGGMSVELNLEGRQTGEMHLDLQNGLLMYMEMNQTASGNATITGPQSMDIPMDIHMRMVIETVDG